MEGVASMTEIKLEDVKALLVKAPDALLRFTSMLCLLRTQSVFNKIPSSK
jgi:hypothetical protein